MHTGNARSIINVRQEFADVSLKKLKETMELLHAIQFVTNLGNRVDDSEVNVAMKP